jgi:hypothetical protein
MEIIILFFSVVLFLIFSIRPKIGLYLLAFLLPVIGLDFNLANFSFPLIDLIAFLLFLAFVCRLFYSQVFEPAQKVNLKWPLFFPFALFLGAGLLSAILAANPIYSLWYFCRWPLFLYLAYIFLPYNLIKDQKTLKRVIISAASSSLVVLLFGFLSLYGQDWRDSFFRISSISIAGIFPFGANHNLIAEFLNVGAWFILALRFLAKDQRFKRLLDILFLLSVLGIIMTFSRSGWLILFLQVAVYAIVYLRSRQLKGRDFILPVLYW